MIAMSIGLVGCAGGEKMSDRKADVSYAEETALATAPMKHDEEKNEQGEGMFPVAVMPKGKVTSPSILPPGSVLKERVQKPTPSKAGIILVKGKPASAWSSVGNVLESAGYTILAKDSKLGVYYIWQRDGGKTSLDRGQVYQIRLNKHGDGDTQLVLTDEQNQALSPSNAKKLMAELSVLAA